MSVVAHDDQLAFRFRGGRSSLNLVATVGWRGGSRQVERLRTAHDLARWFVEAGLAPRLVPVSDRELRSAKRLREAIWQLATARMTGTPMPSSPRRAVNEIARLPSAPPQLTAAGRLQVAAAEAPGLLAVVARDAVELLGTSVADRLRQCARTDCTLLFLDESRSGRRRWCAMDACGNRAKTKHYRERKRS